MAEAVLDDGVAFEMANNGMPPMVYMEKNPHLSGLFNKAMFQMSVLVCEKMLQCFTGFADDGIRTLVDVGGGGSTVLGMITSRYKHIKGIDFDMPFVIAKESQYQV
jgi:caffeic acid 3-O-methyltransferase